jgi:hypothetical protein
MLESALISVGRMPESTKGPDCFDPLLSESSYEIHPEDIQ